MTFNINSNTPGTGHDQLVVSNGNVSLGGANLSLTLPSSITDVVGMSYTIIKVVALSNSVSGNFAGLAEGDEVDAAPLRFRISYAGGDGNDVVLTIIGAVPSGRRRTGFNGALQGDARSRAGLGDGIADPAADRSRHRDMRNAARSEKTFVAGEGAVDELID